jgi:hypothetical protein
MDGEDAARHWDGAGACRKIQTISKAKSRLTRISVGFDGFFFKVDPADSPPLPHFYASQPCHQGM